MIESHDLLIYTEASPQIGHGHVMRCVAIAEEAQRRGLSTAFAVGDAYTGRLVTGMGGKVLASQPALAASYVVRDFRDGSPVEAVLENRRQGARVLLLDDLTTARTVADVVCDSLMTADRAACYPHAEGVSYLYGLEYAPLRSEFRRTRTTGILPGRGSGSRLLVCFGGSDSLGIAPRFVDALACEGHRGPATIVVDESQGDVVAATVAGWDDTTVATEMRDMAAAMRDAVLVATKLGLTVLESFCLGNGCVLIEPSTAHLELSKRLESNYPGWPATELGLESATDFADAASKTMALLADTTRLSEMGASGASLVDGCGTQRIVDALVCGSG